MRYTYPKLSVIRTPETRNTQSLCRESVTNHGTDESTEATVAPSPRRTRSDGRAQQRRVPNDVKSDKYPRTELRLPVVAMG
jgi:hypothetical protein